MSHAGSGGVRGEDDMSWTRANDGRVITDAVLDAAIARDNEAREERIRRQGIKARERETKRMREGKEPGPSRFCQKWNQTPAFQHCCDRFYAQVDYDIRMWDREQALRLGVRQAVAEEERRKRERREMRGLIREDLIRRGLV